ncbi:hypothetical protein ACFQ0X_08420 [Streptomyces rectiviolaceus]|uniref:Secreted protein n=1 Tax=Streptomyces rectiviolaceus TaxID=332591 RepID=A0ABP6MFL3_9ACTN
MSLRVRRLALVSLAALALTAGGAATATASSLPPQAVTYPAYPGPDGFGDHEDHDHDHERPLHVGPFDVPREGTVSGGFSWDVED